MSGPIRGASPIRTKLLRPRIALLTYEDLPTLELERSARAVLPVGTPKRSNEVRWREFLAGRTAAANLLKGLGISGPIVPNEEFGFLTIQEPDLYLNISHTNGTAVAAVAPSPVGVDIELLDRDASKVLERVASREEKKRMAHLAEIQASRGDRVPAGIALWSAKEAVSKALGLGIKFGMAAFEIEFSAAGPVYRVKAGLSGPLALAQPGVWLLKTGRHVLSVCSEWVTISQECEVFSVG